MIETGEWVRCDAALDRPDRRAHQIAATGDLRNLRPCQKVLPFLGGDRQRGWARARDLGWVVIPDHRFPDVRRNLCPRHAVLPADRLVLTPLRQVDRERAEDVALALVDAAADAQALAALLERQRVDRQGLSEGSQSLRDLLELIGRQERHEALLASVRAPSDER